MDYSNISISDKKKLLETEEDIDKLVRYGLHINLEDIIFIHNENIPISFYSNFNISANDFIKRYMSNYAITKQILEEILENDIELYLVKFCLLGYNNLTFDDFIKIQNKYNIMEKDFLNTYLSKISKLNSGNIKIIEYILEEDINCNFNCLLDTAIGNLNMGLIEKLLDKGAVPNYCFYFNIKEESKIFKALEFLFNYIDKENVYQGILNNLYRLNYNLVINCIMIKFMANIKSYDKAISDIISTYN